MLCNLFFKCRRLFKKMTSSSIQLCSCLESKSGGLWKAGRLCFCLPRSWCWILLPGHHQKKSRGGKEEIYPYPCSLASTVKDSFLTYSFSLHLQCLIVNKLLSLKISYAALAFAVLWIAVISSSFLQSNPWVQACVRIYIILQILLSLHPLAKPVIAE